MSRHIFLQDLERTADHIADGSRADLQVLLRRAALLIRNASGLALEQGIDEALNSLAIEMAVQKADLVETILSDWLVANVYLPICYPLDEESITEGRA
ncbi:hypothetical protein [Mesorhizobium sp. B2-4-6]|uniref:hypothetical protein n=1 Tax=Mesorhizobium sp. B2-4-6 TaxID=2589943 RepID=UPI00112C7F4A|nr:hypothetical protein [Mesorhizobium sp. B2-4-6]TPL51617.1 hypothetical protein FJ957_08555 [Mesorhizobium sp. B2-4-6]